MAAHLSSDAGAAGLLAADVLVLESHLALRTQELRIAREMLSEALDLAHRAIARVAELQAR